jgi:PAS domain S-box-containing protein
MKVGLSPETIITTILDGAVDFAVLILDDEGRIDTWSVGAEKMFGWRADEVAGHDVSIIFVEEDVAAGVPERELGNARARGRAEDTRWHRRKSGQRIFCDGVTNPLLAADGSIAGFVKIARDVTDRYRTEQRLATQLALTTILTEEEPFEQTAMRILQTICEHLGWDIGVLWDALPDGSMRCVETWSVPGVDDARGRALCGSEPLAAGAGLPGVVMKSHEISWVRDFSAHPEFPRAAIAAETGMRAAVAFPILNEGRVTAVMEFFSHEVREPDQALLPVMAVIGAQIGDFIERRRTAIALRQSEARYRIISETAQDAIFTIDEKSRILFANRGVERVFGYKPQELIGECLDMLIPERYRTAHAAGIAHYLQTHHRRIPWSGVELPGLHRDGKEIPLEISFGVSEEHGRTMFTGFARDISERRAALEHERAAREEAENARGQLERRADEESSFRHLASALTGAVEMSDVLYEITNRASLVTRADGVYVERILGPNREVEVVSAAGRGTPTRGTRVSYPGSLTEEIMRNRQPVILADMRELGQSMAPYLVETCANCEVLVTPIIAEEEPLGALVLLNGRASGRRFRDPDILRARTLGDLTSLALRRVRLMEQEREAREKAEAAVRVRDETLGIVSHDLRNPLTKISLSADLLDGATPDEQKDLIETIRRASRQAQRLIQDLLDVARVEAGRFSVRASYIEPAPIVRWVCESNEPIAGQKRQTIECTIDDDLPLVCADRDRLLQVFNNLVGNAMKFTPDDGTIAVEARRTNDKVLFRVRDSGPGIPDADLKNVFRPYWQAKKTAHMGAGLGLAIVRGIVDAHGGEVWAENTPRGGAQFSFTIPAKK